MPLKKDKTIDKWHIHAGKSTILVFCNVTICIDNTKDNITYLWDMLLTGSYAEQKVGRSG